MFEVNQLQAGAGLCTAIKSRRDGISPRHGRLIGRGRIEVAGRPLHAVANAMLASQSLRKQVDEGSSGQSSLLEFRAQPPVCALVARIPSWMRRK
jgi:hypothetical protein